ncbi:glycosyltransferase [Wohlfahrtiimonas sp. G9077]|uniref:glycosyltransferase n=1 Tax=Wohlfahrtiimonas sp. G9077 TaxID=1980118 RepID=UPI001F43B1DA|nr:glycosyltransferase [Wohlfahrtiimonas sp. G9077]
MTMKILQILPALNQGGVEYYVLENCAHIATYANSYVISSGGRLVSRLEQAGSTHFTLPIEKKRVRSLLQIGKLARLINEIEPDIIHIHSRLQAWLVHFALKRVKTRPHIVTTVHGFNSISRYSEQMLKADRVIVVSKALENYLINAYPRADMKRFAIITQGIDPTIFHRNVTVPDAMHARLQTLGITEQDQILLLAGRITRIKGIPLVIELMAKLKANGITHIKALIVGGYDARNRAFYEEMKALIAAKGLTKSILWYGTCDEMAAIYTRANITLSLTTKPESYGRTVLEALACGTPVIGFNYGGVGENLSRFYPNGAIRPHHLPTLYDKTLEILAIPKAQAQIAPITDTIALSQEKLRDLYQSL